MNRYSKLLILLMAFITLDASACKRSGNRAKVTAIDEGLFYARSVPSTANGPEGKTDVYLVGNAEDTKVDSYDWFNRDKLVLSWSPKAGKVAILKYDPENEAMTLAFYMGGHLLKSYSHVELKRLGAKLIDNYCGVHFGLKILGQEQIPNTNDYVFKIEFESSGIKMFDITTGAIFDKK